MHLRMYLEYIIVFHRSKICWNNKNLRTLTVLFRSLWSSDLSRMNNNKKKLKRIHEASKKCTNITKMERHGYILIEISALFFSKKGYAVHLFSVFSTVYQCLEKSGDLTQKWGQRDTQKCGSHKCTRFCRLSPGSNRERMEFTVSFTLKYFCFLFFRYKRMYQQHTFMLRQCNMSKYHWITLLRMHVWIYRKWTELHR